MFTAARATDGACRQVPFFLRRGKRGFFFGVSSAPAGVSARRRGCGDAIARPAACTDAVRGSGLTVVGDSFHQFEPQGVTGTVLLAESHLAIHTWPEYGFVTVDVYVCNLATDNSDKAKRLFHTLEAAMQPKRTKYQAILRGGKDD